MTEPTAPVLAVDLPAHALLARHRVDGAFTDCHAIDVPRRVTHAAFVEAFLTTPLFGLERRLLALFARRPSTDAQARLLASGTADDRPFAAWTVEARAERQLLLRDFTGRTRTWLMTEPQGEAATRLYLGSAVLPAGIDASGRPVMGAAFHALKPFHMLYSRALLTAARRCLARTGAADADPLPVPSSPTVRPPDPPLRVASAPTSILQTPPAPTATAPTPPSRTARSRTPPARTPPAPTEPPRRRRGGTPWRERPTREQIAEMPPFEALPLERIVLVRTPAEIDDALQALRRARTVGFDTESKPTFTRDAVRDGPHVIQFATPDRAFVVQVDDRVPIDFLRAVLDTEDVVKVGFGLDSDRGPLEHKLGLRLRGTVELSQVLRRLGHKDALGAKAAVAVVLGRRLQKSKSVQTSNWGAAVLTPQQLRYAGNDAYAALKVYQAMEEDRT